MTYLCTSQKFQLLKCSILGLILFIYSCNKVPKIKSYPSIIQKNGLQNQYDIAVLEMYRLNSCCNCKVIGNDLGKDTLNNLEVDIKLDTIIYYQDTISFFFKYYKIDSTGNEVFYYPIGNGNWTECLFNTISFKGSSLFSFPRSIGDISISQIDSNFVKKTRQNFSKCLENRKLSTTLSQYINGQ